MLLGTVAILSAAQQVSLCFPGGPQGWGDTSVLGFLLFSRGRHVLSWQVHSLSLTSTGASCCRSSPVPDREQFPQLTGVSLSGFLQEERDGRWDSSTLLACRAVPQPGSRQQTLVRFLLMLFQCLGDTYPGPAWLEHDEKEHDEKEHEHFTLKIRKVF